MLAVGPTLNSERGPFCIERWTLSVERFLDLSFTILRALNRSQAYDFSFRAWERRSRNLSTAASLARRSTWRSSAEPFIPLSEFP